MKRFFGMMPSDCIEKEKRFKTESGLVLQIQAGREGWTIIYADGSSEYKDISDTTENNFNEAYERVKKLFPEMEEI